MKSLFSSFFLLFLFSLITEVRAAEIDTTHMAEIPVVELTFDAEQFNSETYIPAQLTLHTIDSVRQYSCNVRHRGGSALMLKKPSYAIKMVSKKGNPKDVRLLGMRKDNNWILDAMASDLARMRNRVSFNLWLDFSRLPYHVDSVPKAVNGSRGRFVEVYANGEYMGVYDLMEKIDRKQLKLKKFDYDEDSIPSTLHGILYKAVTHGRTSKFLWQQTKPDNASSSYDGMQAEYPNIEAGEPFDWNPLRDNIYFLVACKGETFVSGVPLRFDLPVFIDYILFIDLLYAEDNKSKNFFCWFYDLEADNRIGITPWDMDSTWGRNYLRTRVSAQSDLDDRGNFDTRMQAQWPGYQDTLNLRWAELRQTWFDEASLVARFDSCFDLFIRTGVKEREAERWHDVNNINLHFEEQEYLRQWIHDRLAYLDEVYQYEAPVAIQECHVSDSSSRRYDLFGRELPVGGTKHKGLILQDRKIYLSR